jgi:hypothetical protein
MRNRIILIIAGAILTMTLVCGGLALASSGRVNAKSAPATSAPTMMAIRPTPRPFGTPMAGSGGIIQYRVERLKP